MIIRKRYFPWCVILFMVVLSTVTMAQNVKEQDLIAVLKSDAPKGEKAITVNCFFKFVKPDIQKSGLMEK